MYSDDTYVQERSFAGNLSMHFVEMGQRFAANTYSLNQIGIFKRLQVQKFNFMGFNY